MRLLGEIVKLQVQVESLKVGETNRRRYDPAGLREVAALVLSGDGVEGVTSGGTTLDDVHNLTHPATKSRRGSNGISIGFTSHYRAMRERFGEHVVDGIAGENILVRVDDPDALFTEGELARGVVIQTVGGETVRLADVIVAAPCVEFSRFALQFPDDARPDRTVTAAVQFLDAGMRGFYSRYQGTTARIAIGDRLYAATS